nr:type II secretion system F family protein [Actinomyces sp.]
MASPAGRVGWTMTLGLIVCAAARGAALPWSTVLAVCVASMVVVGLALRRWADARRRRRLESWPEAVDLLGAAVRQGVGLPEALSGLAEAGPPALRCVFGAFAVSYTLSGSLDEALERLDDELDERAGERLVALVRLAQAVGTAGLATALLELSATLRAELAARRVMATSLSWVARGSCVLTLVPWLVVGAHHWSAARLTLLPLNARLLLAGACLSGAAGLLACIASRLPEGVGRR